VPGGGGGGVGRLGEGKEGGQRSSYAGEGNLGGLHDLVVLWTPDKAFTTVDFP
jgi:hypothetical protein